MVAAGEIFQVVKSTISEYQEEIDRTKEENRYLRQRLAEVGNNGQSRPDSISSHIHGAPLVQHPSEQQEQIPGQVQMDSETSSPKVKQELGTTLQDSTQQESVTSASTCSTAFVKTADEELPHCLLKKTTNTDKREDEPLFTEADIKIEVEPDRMDCGVSEPICGPQPICSLNPESAAIQSESMLVVYAVVEFLEENSLAIVAKSWILESDSGVYCYWPPSESTKYEEVPDRETWQLYKVRIIENSFTSNYQQAMTYLHNAEILPHLHHECSLEMERYRRKTHYWSKSTEDDLDTKSGTVPPEHRLTKECHSNSPTDTFEIPQPLTTIDELTALCDKLENDPCQRDKLLAYMSSMCSNTVGSSVRRIMKGLGTNGLWSHYSLRGRKGKRPFIELPIVNIITKACLHTIKSARVVDIELEVAECLKHAPNRPGGLNYMARKRIEAVRMEDLFFH